MIKPYQTLRRPILAVHSNMLDGLCLFTDFFQHVLLYFIVQFEDSYYLKHVPMDLETISFVNICW